MVMSERSLLGLGPQGFHTIAYTQWGESHNKNVLICVHGLTRNGRDFDDLALSLSDRWRVLCPDMVGSGNSDWLANATDYTYGQYQNDATALIARGGTPKVDWVGTSMGGLIGLLLAAQSNSPIRRLVLNDVGPFVPRAALERIRKCVCKEPIFPDLAAAEAYLRQVNVSFGRLTNAQWQRMARTMTRLRSDNGYELNYDPGVTLSLQVEALADMEMWSVWEKVRCPVLVLRGQVSDLLTAETAERMRTCGAQVVEIPDCGHAPALMDPHQIGVIRDFLMAS